MKEIGLEQMEPTPIYQDNQAAIQIAINRGALAKKTRAMEMRTLTIRNKIEDMKVIPLYCETLKMLADLGTKALDPTRFEILRDAITGYGLLESWKQGKVKEFAALMVKLIDKMSKEMRWEMFKKRPDYAIREDARRSRARQRKKSWGIVLRWNRKLEHG